MRRGVAAVLWVVTAVICVATTLPKNDLPRTAEATYGESVQVDGGEPLMKRYTVTLDAASNPSGSSANRRATVQISSFGLTRSDGGSVAAASDGGMPLWVTFADGSVERAVFAACPNETACEDVVEVRIELAEAPAEPVSVGFSLWLEVSPTKTGSGVTIRPE